MEQETLKEVAKRVLARIMEHGPFPVHPQPVPVGVSNRHLHLSSSDLEALFGAGYKLRPLRPLPQPGQFAAEETVIIAGPKGSIERVRVLGPVRKRTQVEISRSDAYRLGVFPPPRESGDLAGSEKITVIGPKGARRLEEGLIVARRHIHMTPADAEKFGVSDGEKVRVKVDGERGLIFDQVIVRIDDDYRLEFHLDIDEANAADLTQGALVHLLPAFVFTATNAAADSAGAGPAAAPLSLVTEDAVRTARKTGRSLVVKKDSLYTPLARDAIKELKVNVILR